MIESIDDEVFRAIQTAEAIIKDHAGIRRISQKIREYPKKDPFLTKALIGLAALTVFFGILEAVKSNRKKVSVE